MVVAISVAVATGSAQAAAGSAERGEYLTAAAGCVSCHTDRENDGAPFAGGHELETPYGTFVAPNITADAESGIGGWSDAEFLVAVKQGVAPNGSHYYPAFPYPSYAGMSDQDVLDIKAWLDTQPVVDTTDPHHEHRLRWYVPARWAMRIWNALFSPWQYSTEYAEPELARGAYLVRHLGHCGECHTPRNIAGALSTGKELRGSPKDAAGRSAPGIDSTALRDAGWSLPDVEFFLELGMLPDGDFVGGSMTAVIDDNTAQLTAEDRQAIARYLLNVGN